MKPAFLLIGLGNVGKSYTRTRHNVGFAAAEHAAVQLKAGEWVQRDKFESIVCEAEIDGQPLFIVKPTTYMNLSGIAIKKLTDFYKLDPATQILVCCDDVDLPIGTHRFRASGGPGTHNGLKSIVDVFGESFPRLRIGLGKAPAGFDLAAWVLSRLPEEEEKLIAPSYAAVAESIRSVMRQAAAVQ